MDEKRFNTGTGCGRSLIERSLRELGCGRSVLFDRDGNILCGHDVYETAKRLGKRVVTVETDGDVLVVVKRTDLSIDSKKGLEMMLVDNLTQEKNLHWDADAIFRESDRLISFDVTKWGGHSCVVKELDITELLKDGVPLVQKKTKKTDNEQLEQLSFFD